MENLRHYEFQPDEVMNLMDGMMQLDDEINQDDLFNDREYIKSLVIPALRLRIKSNHKSEERVFKFGSLAISESMAYLIQNHIHPKNEYFSIVQYDIAKILYEHMMGNVISDEMIVELCDISLMNNNPGAYYYLVLLCMKKCCFLSIQTV